MLLGIVSKSKQALQVIRENEPSNRFGNEMSLSTSQGSVQAQLFSHCAGEMASREEAPERQPRLSAISIAPYLAVLRSGSCSGRYVRSVYIPPDRPTGDVESADHGLWPSSRSTITASLGPRALANWAVRQLCTPCTEQVPSLRTDRPMVGTCSHPGPGCTSSSPVPRKGLQQSAAKGPQVSEADRSFHFFRTNEVRASFPENPEPTHGGVAMNAAGDPAAAPSSAVRTRANWQINLVLLFPSFCSSRPLYFDAHAPCACL